MRAVSYDAYAPDNSRLRYGELPEPKVAPGQVLIAVRAAGVNPVDWKVMAGGLDPLMDAVFPVIPGWDVAGVVVRTGPDAPEFAPGDEVMSYARKETVHGGTFAEYIAVDASAVARKPAGLDWAQAGGLPLAGLTALRSLDWLAVERDDILLVHGAAGGVGSLAVQLGAARGAQVIGTASERNHAFVRRLGAEPVTYGDGLVERVRALAPGECRPWRTSSAGSWRPRWRCWRPAGGMPRWPTPRWSSTAATGSGSARTAPSWPNWPVWPTWAR